jgi:hypothetical protein
VVVNKAAASSNNVFKCVNYLQSSSSSSSALAGEVGHICMISCGSLQGSRQRKRLQVHQPPAKQHQQQQQQ